MPRSERVERASKYASVREAAQKMSMGFQATYLNLPSGVSLWKPKAGTYLIDILPYRVGSKNPRAEKGQLYWEYTYSVHRGIGPNQGTFICPARTSDEPCPICEFRDRLTRKADEDDEKLIKSLVPKQRQLINLIDLKEPDKGVQIYETSSFNFGDQLMQDILGSDEEEGWDTFFSLEDGCTLRVNMVEDSFGGRSFIKAGRFDFKERKRPYDDDILDEVHNLEKLLKELEYEDLKSRFLAVAKPTDDDDEAEEPKARHRGKEEEEEEEPKPRRRAKDDDEEEPKSRRKVDDDDDWEKDKDKDDDEEPKAKRKRDADDDDEPKAKKRGKAEEDDLWEEDEPKSKRKREADDDEVDNHKPHKRAEVDEDEPPRKKRKVDDDDDDEPVSRKRGSKAVDDDDDDEPKSKKDDDWEDFDDDDDEPKSKKRGDDDDDEEEKPRRRRHASKDD